MFSLYSGLPIAKIIGGEYNGEIVFLKKEDDKNNRDERCCRKCSNKCKKKPCCKKCEYNDEIGDNFILEDGKLQPLMNVEQRSVNYVAGPSGSGKSTYASDLIRTYRKIFPEKELFIFSRTNAGNDPALVKLGGRQVEIGEKLVTNPINIEKQLKGGCIILFDDCNTIQNEKFKKAVDKLMEDIMETGRKMDITTIITNHLVIPNEKKFARTVLNEIHSMTFFPKSGSSQQIRYALKTYFGLNNKQIDELLALPSRWVTISKQYPMFVLHEKGGFILK